MTALEDQAIQWRGTLSFDEHPRPQEFELRRLESPQESLTAGYLSWATPAWQLLPPMGGPAWLVGMVDRLNALACLPSNWDSYNGHPLSEKAALSAIELLVGMGYSGSVPWINPDPDGAAHLEWQLADGRDGIEVVVGADGEVDVVVDFGGEVRDWQTSRFGDPDLASALDRVSRHT